MMKNSKTTLEKNNNSITNGKFKKTESNFNNTIKKIIFIKNSQN